MSLSDLDLVAQAMAPTEPGAQGPKPTDAAGAKEADKAGADDDVLAGIDLSTLNDTDRKALQPILDALKASAGTEGAEGGDLDVEGILKQLEAADNVADTLEGRLDTLLAHLGEIEHDVEAKAPAAAAPEKK
ncbi:uncharacterized protein LOC62_03G004594 [Vanrija pseudolonga]|uniref:Uncharacterized protein n=1 Tax=Vanrija pseudolonga TaxID=143232 RepID=A0AAF0YAH5_9TREE|nr:hypothetical protein LOC62_03G004594 [Vanrija pseudolonga]